MSVKAPNTAIDQLELFRPPAHRLLWEDVPECIKAEVRKLVAQMLRTHEEVNTTERPVKEVNDD